MTNSEAQEILGISKATSLEQKVFTDDTIKSINLRFYPKGPYSFSKGPKCGGTIDFQTGQTSGSQEFEGVSIVEVMKQMQDFLESL